MTPVEFYYATVGYNKKVQEDRNVNFFLVQQHAIWTSWSTKQANAIKRRKSPWLRGKKKEPIKAETAIKIFDLISTDAK